MSGTPPIVLTVAGSDPSGGAGLQADLKTIHQHGGYGAAVPTLITVQSTQGVKEVSPLRAELVRAQLATLLEDLEPKAAKTGALGSPGVAHLLGAVMEQTEFPWVVDPVWLPSRGRPLSVGKVVDAYRESVIPHATLVTPNLQEAQALAGTPVGGLKEARQAAERIVALGARAVLIKGGHLEGSERGTDVLMVGDELHEIRAEQVFEGPFHGTGCALSAAIATRLAHDDEIFTAVVRAKVWLTGALAHAFRVGKGTKPVNHLWRLDRKTQ
jgi:hydroxymethylpyrimidine/phosphomethylpyrimidine kinase